MSVDTGHLHNLANNVDKAPLLLLSMGGYTAENFDQLFLTASKRIGIVSRTSPDE